MGNRAAGPADHTDLLGHRPVDLGRGRRARWLAPPRHSNRLQLAGGVASDPASGGTCPLCRARAAYRSARLGGGGTYHHASARSDAGLSGQRRDRCKCSQDLDPDRRTRRAFAGGAVVGCQCRVQLVRASHYPVFAEAIVGQRAQVAEMRSYAKLCVRWPRK